jgi:hypothetical protein
MKIKFKFWKQDLGKNGPPHTLELNHQTQQVLHCSWEVHMRSSAIDLLLLEDVAIL